MSTGSPPSWRSHLPRDPEIVQARGTLRDAIGALGNLDRLLASIRVAPKALGSVVPDVHDSCLPAQTALQLLLGSIEQVLEDTTPTRAISDYMQPRFAGLEKGLGAARAGAMNARRRLELERLLSGVAPGLEAALELLDLLEDAIWAPQIPIKFSEVLQEISGVETKGSVVLSVPAGIENVEFSMSPVVATRLLLLAIHRVAGAGSAAVLTLDEADGTLRTQLRPEAGPTQGLTIRLQRMIEPSIVVFEAVAARAGCRVTYGEDLLSLDWPPSPPSR